MAENQQGVEFDPRRLSIDMHRHLINDATKENTGVMEYFDTFSGKRVLTIPRLSHDAVLHQELIDKRIPVYPRLALDDRNMLLDVPNDARTIQSNLRFIARDVLHYKEIFTQIGEVLGRCAVNRIGLPDQRIGRTMLSGIAFSYDEADSFGGNVHLLPPYTLNPELDKTAEFTLLRSELIASEYISPAIADELVRATNEGWESVRSS